MRIFLLLTILYIVNGHSLLSQVADTGRSPYHTNWTTDGIIFGTSIVVAFSASEIDNNIPILTKNEIEFLSKKDINAIDRITSGFYSKEQSTVSDILVGSSIVSPLFLILDKSMRNDMGTIATMYLETMIFTTFIPSFGKGGVQRIRPYVYGTNTPLSLKMDAESRRSFFSGHATAAFASSIFFASVYSDYHPNSKYKDYVWYGTIGLASTVSILRVSSGAHFISDIVVGAAVGSSIGYLIPYLHRTNSEDFLLLPNVTQDFKGLSLSIRL